MAIKKETWRELGKYAVIGLILTICVNVGKYLFSKAPQADAQVPATVAYILSDAELRKQFGFSETGKVTMEDVSRFECELIYDIGVVAVLQHSVDLASDDPAYVGKASVMQANVDKFGEVLNKNFEYIYGVPGTFSAPVIAQASDRCMRLSTARQHALSKRITSAK